MDYRRSHFRTVIGLNVMLSQNLCGFSGYLELPADLWGCTSVFVEIRATEVLLGPEERVAPTGYKIIRTEQLKSEMGDRKYENQKCIISSTYA